MTQASTMNPDNGDDGLAIDAAMDNGTAYPTCKGKAYFAQRRAIADAAIANGEVGPAIPLDPNS